MIYVAEEYDEKGRFEVKKSGFFNQDTCLIVNMSCLYQSLVIIDLYPFANKINKFFTLKIGKDPDSRFGSRTNNIRNILP